MCFHLTEDNIKQQTYIFNLINFFRSMSFELFFIELVIATITIDHQMEVIQVQINKQII
jgi:hypothetical protein